MSGTISGIRIADLPNLGAVTDSSIVVGDHAGTGSFTGPALKTYVESDLLASGKVVTTVMYYGATGNGTTDDTAAFQAAIAAAHAAGGGTVLVPWPPTSYKISATLVLPGNVCIVGDAGHSLIVPTAANFSLFSITGDDTTIANLEIQNAAKTGGVDFSLDVGTATVNRTRLTNILCWDSYGCVADSGASNGCYISTWIREVQARRLRGIGFNLQRSYAFLFVEDSVADFVGSSSANFTGFSLDNTVLSGLVGTGGARFRNCDVEGTSTGTGANASQVGFAFTNTTAVWLDGCDADTCDRFGWNFSTVNHLHMSLCTASLCNDMGMVFSTCQFVEMAASRVYGRGLVVGTAGVAGINFATGCVDVSMTGCSALDCRGSGIVVSTGNPGAINICGGQSRGNSSYGVATAGTNAVLVVGMTLSANGTNNYSLGGGNHYIASSQGNAGSILNAGPGPVTG